MKPIKSPALAALGLMGRRLRRTPLVRLRFLDRLLGRIALRMYGSNVVPVGPFQVRFDPRDLILAKKLVLYGGWEKHEIELLCSVVTPGDCVLDVGANIGIHSLFLSRAVGPEGRVIAVEPDPDNLALLRANLEANHCDNVKVVPCAFGADSGCARLFRNPNSGANSAFFDVSNSGRYISVPVRRGVEVLEELGVRPNIAKMDVEGAEPLVLSGLGSFLPDILLFEFEPARIRSQGSDAEGFLQHLVAEGYSLEKFDTDTGTHVPTAPAEIMATARSDSSLRYGNVLAVRRRSSGLKPAS